MTLAIRFWIAIIFVVAATGSASAQDTYNFYFQKKGKKVEQPTEPVPEKEEVEEEYVEEVMEVDSDVLLVPDDWKPHQKRYKKVYVRKPKKVFVREPKQEIKAEIDEPKRKKNKDRGWQAKLGIGQVSVDNHYNTPFGGTFQLSQKTYVLGATYHMSRYFEVNGELHLPNGEAEADGSTLYGDYNTDPQFSIGLGATPIHLNVFGGEFLAIGVDGGVSVGNQSGYDESTNRVYLGPRISMNFSDSFSMIYAFRRNISGESDFSTSSLALAYKW